MNKLETFALTRLLLVADKIGVEVLQRRMNIISSCLGWTVGLTIAGSLFFWIYAHNGMPFLGCLLSYVTSNIVVGKLLEARAKKLLSKNEVSLRLPVKYLFCFLLPKKIREPLLGDIEEEYQEMKTEYGERIANLWYYKQLLALLWPTLQMSVRTLAKWGFVGWLEEIIRRIAH